MHRAFWLLLLLAVAAGCGDDHGAGDGPAGDELALQNPTEKPPTWPSAEARRLGPGTCPTPYTAEQIRRGCRDGRSAIYRFDMRGNEMLQTWRFDKGDADGVEWTMTPVGPDGAPQGEPKTQRHEWKELQAHASFPAADTVVSEEVIEVPAGRFACMLYTVATTRKVEGEARRAVTKYWFAWALPGPPVRMEQRAEDTVVSTMELVEHAYERSR